jgi:hypothetical protein
MPSFSGEAQAFPPALSSALPLHVIRLTLEFRQAVLLAGMEISSIYLA